MEFVNNGEKRIVSFFIWDPELERKIDCEVKMIDGISKLLNVATTLEQAIECHKALVLSQQRMLAFMSEIQRKQRNLLQRDTDFQPTKATVILSDIRLPLVWTNMKGKSEQKKFSVFCLARIGCDIIDTQLKSIDKQSKEILFTEKLHFDNVPHNFELYLEIYALNKTLALSSSVKDFANRYSYFSTHKLPHNNSTNITHKSAKQQQSKFVLIARTIFTKESVNKTARVQYLKLEPPQENPLMRLPISTSFTAHFIAQPLCYTRLPSFVGIVIVDSIRYSCILTAGFLHGEEIMRDDFSDQHRFSIPITSDTFISSHNDRLSFSIYTHGFDEKDFFVQDLFTLNNWIRALQQHIVDIHAWQSTFEHVPYARRYSHQSNNSLPRSSILKRSLTEKPILKTKARSLSNLHQRNISFQTKTVVHFNSDQDDDDDDDDFSACQTRF